MREFESSQSKQEDNTLRQRKEIGKNTSQNAIPIFKDKRSSTLTQQALQKKADHSPQLKAADALQAKADALLQNNNSHPIQRVEEGEEKEKEKESTASSTSTPTPVHKASASIAKEEITTPVVSQSIVYPTNFITITKAKSPNLGGKIKSVDIDKSAIENSSKIIVVGEDHSKFPTILDIVRQLGLKNFAHERYKSSDFFPEIQADQDKKNMTRLKDDKLDNETNQEGNKQGQKHHGEDILSFSFYGAGRYRKKLNALSQWGIDPQYEHGDQRTPGIQKYILQEKRQMTNTINTCYKFMEINNVEALANFKNLKGITQDQLENSLTKSVSVTDDPVMDEIVEYINFFTLVAENESLFTKAMSEPTFEDQLNHFKSKLKYDHFTTLDESDGRHLVGDNGKGRNQENYITEFETIGMQLRDYSIFKTIKKAVKNHEKGKIIGYGAKHITQLEKLLKRLSSNLIYFTDMTSFLNSSFAKNLITEDKKT